MLSIHRTFGIAALLACAFGRPAGAAVIFSNLNSDVAGFAGTDFASIVAQRFTPGSDMPADSRLYSIQLYLYEFLDAGQPGGDSELALYLDDGSGSLPIFQTLSKFDQLSAVPNSPEPGIVEYRPESDVLLQPGLKYWVALLGHTSKVEWAFAEAGDEPFGLVAPGILDGDSDPSQLWYSGLGGTQMMEVQTVPEPGSWTLLAGGIALMVAGRLRK